MCCKINQSIFFVSDFIFQISVWKESFFVCFFLSSSVKQKIKVPDIIGVVTSMIEKKVLFTIIML